MSANLALFLALAVLWIPVIVDYVFDRDDY